MTSTWVLLGLKPSSFVTHLIGGLGHQLSSSPQSLVSDVQSQALSSAALWWVSIAVLYHLHEGMEEYREDLRLGFGEGSRRSTGRPGQARMEETGSQRTACGGPGADGSYSFGLEASAAAAALPHCVCKPWPGPPFSPAR